MSSTDPKDKLYAFRGLSSNNDLTPSPKYSNSVKEVYTELAKYFVSQGQGMQLLHEAGITRSTRILNLPSWVVDWSFKKQTDVLRHTKPYDSILTLDSVPIICRYPVSEVKLSQQLNVLSVSGVVMDRILFQTKATWLHKRVIASDATRYAASELLSFLKNSTKVGARHKFHVKSTASKIKSGQLTFYLYNGGNVGDPFEVAPKHLECPNTQLVTAEEFLGNHLGETMAVNGRFCVTQSGRLGYVPALTETDDLIAIFKGARAPFVLRRTAQEPQARHILIGDAYLEGMMKEEELGKLNLQFEEILIE